MAPTMPTSQSVGTHGRSDQRKRFCSEGVRNATTMAKQLFLERSWRDCFNDATASEIRRNLIKCEPMSKLKQAAQRLSDCLGALSRPTKNDPQFLVIIDEASSLLKSGNVRFIAFNRVWSCLRRMSFWAFLLSTDSQI